jgi:hypothetical protein
MPMARQRLILAICPTSDPTAPAAPDTTTVSPACGRQISSSPKYAVRPGIPSALQSNLAEVNMPASEPPRSLSGGACSRFAGPAYLVSVGYMDPGNWATDLEGGARFGYRCSGCW